MARPTDVPLPTSVQDSRSSLSSLISAPRFGLSLPRRSPAVSRLPQPPLARPQQETRAAVAGLPAQEQRPCSSPFSVCASGHRPRGHSGHSLGLRSTCRTAAGYGGGVFPSPKYPL